MSDNDLPLVTVGTAFFNTGPALLDMVRSVFAQTYPNWELILLDDGSTDNTLQLARSIHDSRVRVYTNEKNLGRSVSLNKLTSLAKGKYIARMDSDDICSPSRLEKQVQFLEAHPHVDAVSTGICYLDEYDNPVGHAYLPEKHEDICRNPSGGIRICHGALLARTDWYKKNAYDESIRYAVDFDFFLRSYEHSIFANLPQVLYYYKLSSSFSLKKQLVARCNTARILAHHCMMQKKPLKAAAVYLYQWIKFGAVILYCVSGSKDSFIARRYTKLTPEEAVSYIKEIELIRGLALPRDGE